MEDEITEQEKEKFNQLIENDIKVVSKLEDYFCTSPEFSNSIHNFFAIQSVKFKESVDSEHPIENFNIYKMYCIELENLLESFMKKENIKAEDLVESCDRIREIDDSMSCLDYLIAAADYQDFYDLMIEQQLQNYGGKSIEQDKFDFYLDNKKSTVNIVDNSGAKIILEKGGEEEIVEEIIIENDNKNKFGKK